MYTKEQLIHEVVKVLKVSYYFIILFSIKILLEIGLMFIPNITQTVTYDKGQRTEKITKTYRFFGPNKP